MIFIATVINKWSDGTKLWKKENIYTVPPLSLLFEFHNVSNTGAFLSERVLPWFL